MDQTAANFIKALSDYASEENSKNLARFFKTGKGQYGEGDVFIGVKVPQTRAVCRKFKHMPLPEIQKLLDSKVHEHRLAAVILLAGQIKQPKISSQDRSKIYQMYLKNVRAGRVNNWDLVDLSAGYIMGTWLADKPKDILFELANSPSLWCRRAAIMSAFEFIMRGDATTSLQLAQKLLYDPHDLIQKAVGWQLREIGKRVNRKTLLDFLDAHAATMPRTTLRYAIEHLSPSQRQHYMQLKTQK